MIQSGPIALLRERAFRRVWLIGIMTGFARWSDVVITGIYVYDVTDSVGTVATVTFLRSLPMVAGAVSGALAARVALGYLMRVALGVIAIVYGILGVLAGAGGLEIAHVAIGGFFIGLYWSTEMSVRRTLLGEIAGAGRVNSAMGLDWATINVARLVGPFAGSAVYVAFGVGAWFAACAAMFAISALLTLDMGAGTQAPGARGRDILSSILDDVLFAARNPMVSAVLAITLALNLLGFPYSAMVPVIGKEALDASPLLVGLLSSAEGAGAVLGAMAVAGVTRPGRFGPLYLAGSLVTMAGALVFGLSVSYALSLLALLAAGVGAAMYATMQSTLILTHSPPERRSRTMGLITTAIGLGQCGVLQLGLLAGWIGAGYAVALSEIAGIAVLLLCVWLRPALRRSDPPPAA